GSGERADGRAFNPAKLLLDPYARGLVGELVPDEAAYSWAPDGTPIAADSIDVVPHGVVMAPPSPARGERPRTPWSRTVIYEAHVRGLTERLPGVPPELRGTYAGLAHPATITHLQRLGVTAVELLPIQAK